MHCQKKNTIELTKIIEMLKACDSLPYLMFAVLHELETIYENNENIENKDIIFNSWNNVHIEETENLIEEIDKIALNKENTPYRIYIDVMKKSRHLINLDFWIKVMELLIYDCKTSF